MLRPFCVTLSLLLPATISSPSLGAPIEADVIVYGGTSAGVTAAVQTARMGKSVVLISPQWRLGGLTTNGLGATDSGNKAVIGGMAREFYQRVKKHYDDPAAWTLVDREKYPDYRAADDAIWRFEPHVAEEVLEMMLREAKVKVIREERLDLSESGVTLDNGRIATIRTEPAGAEYRGKMFIDATYEGDLLAAAGVSYAVGRESNDAYGETCNGVQQAKNVKNHRFMVPVDPYLTPGDSKSGVLPGIHNGPPGKDGAGDDRVQAYCFRMCMSNVPDNRTPFPKPANYDEADYELLLRNFEAGDLRVPMHPLMMPNGKTDTNNNGAVSTDNINMNYDYPDASYERREEIVREHRDYQQGLMWTLANHPRVPGAVRKHMAQWGLAKDEFTDNANWPTELYVREARRMVSDYVMTEHDTRLTRQPEDSVGMGSYNLDSHNCQRYVDAQRHVANEGDVQVAPGGPYAISYRSIVPQRDEVQNLLVPVCMSASHIAYGSIRMEPVFMILGQSAATAACEAIDAGVAVQEVNYDKLKERMLSDGQVLSYRK
ncbi:MAG: FAD-dependent oxidoreductase [Pirellulales bacterium]|nr:FAD-dependent oxidoreductase [Pirellulales bacterium]